jgi:hypothetical protein
MTSSVQLSRVTLVIGLCLLLATGAAAQWTEMGYDSIMSSLKDAKAGDRDKLITLMAQAPITQQKIMETYLSRYSAKHAATLTSEQSGVIKEYLACLRTGPSGDALKRQKTIDALRPKADRAFSKEGAERLFTARGILLSEYIPGR